MHLRVSTVAGVLFATAGCQADLGECSDTRARAIAYSETGLPAYEGQALIQNSCGGGAFCHSRGARNDARFGVPKRLDFDMRLASTGPDENPDGTDRLRHGWRQIRSWRHRSYGLVESGDMPPGDAGELVQVGGELYRRFNGRVYADLPRIDEEEAQAILKNWLACDCPVVERTEGEGTFGDVVPLEDANLPDPTFSSIYDVMIAPLCGSSCHGPSLPMQLEASQLDLSDPEAAYAALISQQARGTECVEGGEMLIVPGDSESSLFLRKITPGEEICGSAMPLNGAPTPEAMLEVIAEWIDSGAESN